MQKICVVKTFFNLVYFVELILKMQFYFEKSVINEKLEFHTYNFFSGLRFVCLNKTTNLNICFYQKKKKAKYLNHKLKLLIKFEKRKIL